MSKIDAWKYESAQGNDTGNITDLGYFPTDTQLVLAINADLPCEGNESESEYGDEQVRWGDLFPDFVGQSSNEVNEDLYTVKFDEKNSSNAPSLGLYQNVTVESVFSKKEMSLLVEKKCEEISELWRSFLDTIPAISEGEAVTWTYEVTNCGNLPFDEDDVEVTHDQGVVPVLDRSSNVGNDGILSPGETWIYTAQGVADWRLTISAHVPKGKNHGDTVLDSGNLDPYKSNLDMVTDDEQNVLIHSRKPLNSVSPITDRTMADIDTINALLDEAAAQTQTLSAQLDEAVEGVSDVEQLIKTLQQSLTGSKEESDNQIEALSVSLETAEQELQSALESSLENLSNLQDQITNFDEQVDQASSDLSERFKDLQSLIEEISDEVDQEFDSTQSLMQKLVEQIQSVAETISEQTESTQQKTETTTQTVDDVKDQIDQRKQQVIEQFIALQQEVETRLSDISEDFESLKMESRDRTSTFKDNLATQADTTQAGVGQRPQILELGQDLAAVADELNQILEVVNTASQQGEGQMIDLTSENDNLTQSEEELLTEFDSFLQELQTFDDELSEITESTVDLFETFQEFASDLEQMLESTSDSMQAAQQELESTLNDRQSEFDDERGELTSIFETVLNMLNQLESTLEGEESATQNSYSELLRAIDDVQQEIEQLQAELEGQIDELETEINGQFTQDLTDRFDELSRQVADEQYSEVSSKFDDSDWQCTEFLDGFKERAEDLCQELQERGRESMEAVGNYAQDSLKKSIDDCSKAAVEEAFEMFTEEVIKNTAMMQLGTTVTIGACHLVERKNMHNCQVLRL